MSSSEFAQASTAAKTLTLSSAAALGHALASVNPRLSITAIALFAGYNAGPLVAAAEDLRWQAAVAVGQELKTLLKVAGETPLTAPAVATIVVQPARPPVDPAPVAVAPAPLVQSEMPAPVKLHRTWHGDHTGSARTMPVNRAVPHDLPKYSPVPIASACGSTSY